MADAKPECFLECDLIPHLSKKQHLGRYTVELPHLPHEASHGAKRR